MGDFTMILNQEVLNEYVFYLKNKYKNKILDLRLDHCTDEYGEYIYLKCIIIKESQKNKGYGSTIMSEIINLADDNNVRIVLIVTDMFGSEIDRLYGFYRKLGFIVSNVHNEKMYYIPIKILKKV